MNSLDCVVNRKNSDCYKWDHHDPKLDVLPMTVADMDFQVAAPITQALKSRVEHAIYGYTHYAESFFQAILDWEEKQHHRVLKKSWIIPTIGIVPAISAILRALATTNDGVILQTPVYNCFFRCIRNANCLPVENPLCYDKIQNRWTIDFDDLRQKASEPRTKFLILCNPHNPVGRVWTKDELLQLNNICAENNVCVIADEIHCDICMKHYTFTPFANISQNTINITCASPSKAFNIAGLQIAYAICENYEARQKIAKSFEISGIDLVNPMGTTALQAAYTPEAATWLNAMNDYVYQNYNQLHSFLKIHYPSLQLSPLEGTYLVWLDCSAFELHSDTIAAVLFEKARLAVNSGSSYGGIGENFIRLNLACPRQILEEGIQRLDRGFQWILNNKDALSHFAPTEKPAAPWYTEE